MRSKRKIAAAALLAFVICLFAPGVSAFADGETYNVSTYDELTAALGAIGANGTGTIVLQADLTNVSSISVNGSKNVTLLGNGHTITFIAGDSCLNISGNATVNLGAPGNSSSTLVLTKNDTNDAAGILSISGNATVNMYDGVSIEDFKNNNYFGAGVTIGAQTSASNKAVFHMYGGTIDNCGVSGGSVCYGGGVAVCNGGTFIMDGGTISNCYASTTYNKSFTGYEAAGCGGGVFVGRGSRFIMNGGTIDNCSASTNGGGVAVYTSFESVWGHGNSYGYLDSEFTMTGGTISGCTATAMGGGVFATGMALYKTAIAANSGTAGTVSNVGIHISGGTISSNNAVYGGGVGILMLRTPVAIENTTIINNTASGEGGGICSLLYWARVNVDNCSITGNNAPAGGGIAIDGNEDSDSENKPIATVTNSSIGNNLASLAASDVYVYDAEMHLEPAVISGIKYKNSVPNDLTGRVINQWFEDIDTSRFVDQAPTARVAQTVLDLSWSSKNEYMLIAAPTSDSPYGTAGGSFVLTKDFNVGNISEKLKVAIPFTISNYKSFNRVAGEDKNVFPAITGSYTIDVGEGESTATINLPDYSAVGVGDYWYTIKENVTETGLTNIAGLINDSVNPRYLHVQVVWSRDQDDRVPIIWSITLHNTPPDDKGNYTDDKSTGFTNIYNAGSLKIEKHVSGNMADPDKLFEVIVTFDSDGKTVLSPIRCDGGFDSEGNLINDTIGWTDSVTVYLKHDSIVTFSNIPYGVKYTITEVPGGYSAAYAIDSTGEEANVDKANENNVTGTISDNSDTVTITNTMNKTIDVGVTLDNAPFVILLAGGVVILAVLLLAKRRRKNVVDEDI